MSEHDERAQMERTLEYIEFHRANALGWVKEGDYEQAFIEVETLLSLAQGLEERLRVASAD